MTVLEMQEQSPIKKNQYNMSIPCRDDIQISLHAITPDAEVYLQISCCIWLHDLAKVSLQALQDGLQATLPFFTCNQCFQEPFAF